MRLTTKQLIALGEAAKTFEESYLENHERLSSLGLQVFLETGPSGDVWFNICSDNNHRLIDQTGRTIL